MKECHTCPTANEIEAGKWSGTPWAKTPCSTCILNRPDPAPSNRGRTHVAFDPGDHGKKTEDDLPVEPDPDDEGNHPIFRGADPNVEHSNHRTPSIMALSFIAKTILSLPSATREIVLDRLAYPDRSIRIAAARLGIGTSSAHSRLKRARETWPALAWAIPMKSWSWGDGKGDGKAGKAPRKAAKIERMSSGA